MTRQREYWVFAYGSLMWSPGFPVAESASARLDGFHRSFCLRSIVYRGTADAPGLVLGLDEDPSAACQGLALRVSEPDWPDALEGLRARELTTNAYEERALPLELADGRRITAITYVIRRDHDQYAGGLALDEQARIIARASGGRGPNAEYLFNTVSHLTEMGVPDHDMDRLLRLVRGLLPPDPDRSDRGG